MIVLGGAVVTATLPSLLAGVERHDDTPGWDLQLALEALACLERSRAAGQRGLDIESLASALRVDPLQLEPPLETLAALDWVGRLSEDEARLVLLVDPAATPLAPLLQALALPLAEGTRTLWQASGWQRLALADVLPRAVA